MGTSRRSAIRFVSPVALLFVVAGPLACYRPAIVDGGLKCNLDAGTKACPEGFNCDTDGRCRRHPLGDGGPDSTDGDGSVDVDSGGDVDMGICNPPRMNCTATPGGGLCDPYCETGCGCHEKCSVNTAGTLTCKPLAMGQVRNLLDPCQIQMGGTVNQIDQCAPGLVCVEDACGAASGTGRCYQFCRNDAECTNAPCNKDVGGGFKVCDVPYRDCVPLAAASNTGCAGAALACYLSTSDATKTICDCEFPPGLGRDDVCTRSRECNPGLVCVDRTGLGTKQCTPVCRRAMPSDCTFGTCRLYMDSGASNPTYGFCG